MKRGLLTTLMAVLSLTWAVQTAEARAPIVADPVDLIISDLESEDEGTTGANVFVYPDAIDLSDLVLDDNTPTSEIKWSYTVTGGNIRINDQDPIDAGVDDPNNPTADQRLDTADDDLTTAGEVSDGDPITATFRNADLSPVGTAPAVENEPGTAGLLTDQTALVTLFASDCTTFSQATLQVFTFNVDSGGTVTLGLPTLPAGQGDATIPQGLTNVLSAEFKGDAMGWTARKFAGDESLGGSTSVDANLGLCMTVDNAGPNGVEWRSPLGFVDPLVMREVYRVRLFMFTDQPNFEEQPVWDWNYINTQADGFLNFGGRRFVVPTEGGANSIETPESLIGRDYFEFWYAPAAVDTPQWNGEVAGIGGAFTPEANPNTDVRYIVRILDFEETLQASVRNGSVYLGKVVVDRFPLEVLDANATTVFNEPISDTQYRAFRPATQIDPLATATFDNAANTLTYSLPSAAEATVDPIRATLGPDVAALPQNIVDPNTGATVRNPDKLFPADWDAETLYRGQVGIFSAVDTGNPVDIIDVTHDVYTLELGGSDWVTSGVAALGAAGMPEAGSPQPLVVTTGLEANAPDWQAYFYGNNVTNSLIQNADRWRMQVDFFNRADIGITDPKDATGTDDFTIDEYLLERIDLQPEP